jgi:putative SOS response-associated peptidase YedK
VAEKPSFRSALRSRRCLVPADGFFEWQRDGAAQAGREGRRAGKPASQPFFIHRKDDDLFAFAGLYEHWRDPEGRLVTSCTIITTAPNSLMAPIHNRMPAMLLPEHEEVWLDPDLNEPEALRALLQPYPDDLLEAYPISPLVNSPSNDRPEVVLPVA